jgi:hypothetical protein
MIILFLFTLSLYSGERCSPEIFSNGENLNCDIMVRMRVYLKEANKLVMSNEETSLKYYKRALELLIEEETKKENIMSSKFLEESRQELIINFKYTILRSLTYLYSGMGESVLDDYYNTSLELLKISTYNVANYLGMVIASYRKLKIEKDEKNKEIYFNKIISTTNDIIKYDTEKSDESTKFYSIIIAGIVYVEQKDNCEEGLKFFKLVPFSFYTKKDLDTNWYLEQVVSSLNKCSLKSNSKEFQLFKKDIYKKIEEHITHYQKLLKKIKGADYDD